MDAFHAANDALFADPNLSEPAIWRSNSVGDVHVRVIRRQPDAEVAFGGSRALVPTVVIDVRRSEAPDVAEGDGFLFGPETFRVIGEPTGDALDLIWTCEAVRV
ncbi:hypothetical protein GJ689_19275 [Rhodoplanes serenus]|uniref:Uncharacterized protein n=1 Tax=Rhodoplanes serenus TaxID=200615 RepID=A0A9X5AT95_9BRAD|nr:hypothetical protein [Rhodoplanes serenus]MTW18347.1 hypothetical protein [Rhodoplanes serenus]